MGELSGIFTAYPSKVKSAIGIDVYLGDVLGKHSDIFFILEEDDVTLVTSNLDAVETFEFYNLETGYNPLNYIEEG